MADIMVVVSTRHINPKYRVSINKGSRVMVNFNTFTRRGARRKSDRFLKTRGKYTHSVAYYEDYR